LKDGKKSALTYSLKVMTARLASTCIRQRGALFCGQAYLREDYLNQVQRDFLSRNFWTLTPLAIATPHEQHGFLSLQERAYWFDKKDGLTPLERDPAREFGLF
jgi:hypothetical protein